MKESKRHSHKPSQIPPHTRKAFPSEQPPDIEPENENFRIPSKSFEFQTRNIKHIQNPDLENEANISFQMTAPKIAFPSPQSFQIKRSYLDRHLSEKDQNVIEMELAASPASQIGPCSRRCTLVANENAEFFKNIGKDTGMSG